MKRCTVRLLICTCLFSSSLAVQQAPAVESVFPYQGALVSAGVPATGTFAMEFRLFDAESAGSLVGAPIVMPSVMVQDGVFQVPLDFGAAAFNGDARWLEVVVGSTTLSPRTRLSAVPYALRAGTVAWDDVTDVPASLLDGDQVNDADADPANELNDSLTVAGTQLQLTDAGGTLTADLSAFDQRLLQTVVVSPGESIQAAIDGITDASALKPYLVKVEPGVYTEQVTLKAHIDLEGSGQERTIISWTGGTPGPNTSAASTTLEIPSDSEVRFLTVESTTTGAYSSAIRVVGATPSLYKVTMKGNGGTFANYPLVVRTTGGANVTDCVIQASGQFARGTYMAGSGRMRLRNTSITVISGGTNGYGADGVSGTMELQDCSILTSGSSGPVAVASGGSGLTLRNCTVQCDGTMAVGVRFTGIGTTTIDGGSIVAIGNPNWAIGVQALSGALSISGAYVRATGVSSSDVISIGGTVPSVELSDSRVVGTAPFGNGVLHNNVNPLTIQNCFIDFASTSGYATAVRSNGGATLRITGSSLAASSTGGNGFGLVAVGGSAHVGESRLNAAGVWAYGADYGGAGGLDLLNCSILATASGSNSFGARVSSGTMKLAGCDVEAGGSPNNNHAVWAGGNAVVDVRHSTLLTTGPGTGGATFRGEAGGIVTATIHGCAIQNTGAGTTVVGLASANADVRDSKIQGTSYAIVISAGRLAVKNCDVSATTGALVQLGGTFQVANTQVDGAVTGTVTCIGAYDENFVALDGGCL